MREWTASDVPALKGVLPRAAAAVRGARHDAADVDHRCAHRSAVSADGSSGDLGFRCCYGEANGAEIPAAGARRHVQGQRRHALVGLARHQPLDLALVVEHQQRRHPARGAEDPAAEPPAQAAETSGLRVHGSVDEPPGARAR
jgi:hypothetical protein